MFVKTPLSSIFLFTAIFGYPQYNQDVSTMVASFEKLNTNPIKIHFTNSLEIDNTGGHLQGIQRLTHNFEEYYVVSGSSSTYSYYSIIKTGERNLVISVNKILEKPFKHAGGFQIYENLMAIGVEDNDAKNKSKVFVFRIDNPEKPPTNPIAIIDRMGTYKRATSGCVGITAKNKKVVVVVGDWDARHLDFYRIDEEKLHEEGASLELEYSINCIKQDKSDWINESWLSYQNINFAKDSEERLFLAAMACDENDENVVDLYLVESEDLSSFRLRKVFTKRFPPNSNTKFRWGSGIALDRTMGIEIVSCGENIKHENLIDIY
ncbi:MAG: hypothetical protein MI975_17210 [Cytophagales bacterium]|nr:hypothetical protein [Cytophagales bacterium]